MKNTINLLQKKSPQEQRGKRKQRFILGAFGGIFFLLLFAWGISFLQQGRLVSSENELLANIDQKEKSIKSLFATERLHNTVYNKASAAMMLIKNEELFLNNINKVKKYINPGLSIKEITIDKEKVKVSVIATDIGSISQYISQLEDENRRKQVFKTLTLSQITIDKARGYEVRIEGIFGL